MRQTKEQWNRQHTCQNCAVSFESDSKDTAHTKYHLHMRKDHQVQASFACHTNCTGIKG